jgi:hypothetical protein
MFYLNFLGFCIQRIQRTTIKCSKVSTKYVLEEQFYDTKRLIEEEQTMQ